MAVMTPAVLDKAPMDLKDPSFSSMGDAAFEPETNGYVLPLTASFAVSHFQGHGLTH